MNDAIQYIVNEKPSVQELKDKYGVRMWYDLSIANSIAIPTYDGMVRLCLSKKQLKERGIKLEDE